MQCGAHAGGAGDMEATGGDVDVSCWDTFAVPPTLVGVKSPRERTLSHASQMSCKFQTDIEGGGHSWCDFGVSQATEKPVVVDPPMVSKSQTRWGPSRQSPENPPWSPQRAGQCPCGAHPEEPFPASILFVIVVLFFCLLHCSPEQQRSERHLFRGTRSRIIAGDLSEKGDLEKQDALSASLSSRY